MMGIISGRYRLTSKPRMSRTKALTQDRLKQLLHYDPGTGEFTWRVSRGTVKAGSKAGSNNQGYVDISIDGVMHKAHRLAWLYIHGKWPDDELDHRVGRRSDNRITQIREATHAENMRNRGAYACNKSGYAGVDWRPSRGVWRARIGLDGKQIHVGNFATAEEAHKARIARLKEMQDEFRRLPLESYSDAPE
ncbi:HNH endonuclease signature motif containing protein [Burkholderia sp. 22088]|uniref:HNH endonuclease signature motif containing protein n=1 Tax=Burkholderia sp. 22088 TaxID=3453871 RepID=UPI003F87E56B